MSLFKELKRRNVFRVAIAYLVVAWLLAQVSATLENALNMPPWFDTMVVSLLLIGFPIALFFAWVFELTPEGIKREKDINRDDSIVDQTSKKLNYVTIIAALAVLAMFVWQQMNPLTVIPAHKPFIPMQTGISNEDTKEPEIKANSIAVLPFADLSQDGDQEYFSDGMAEEILNVLVRVSALQVTSRTSAFQFKESKLGIPEIATQLKVRHVLEGSVRKSGDTLRITAQLIDASNDKHLWSETYDRPLTTDNIFAIQDEISNAIVKALSMEFGIVASHDISVTQSTGNLNAYELFLKARPLFQARKDLDKADQYLISAIELDQQFDQAWAMRAALQSLMLEYGYSETSLEENDKNGIEFADKALAINPNSALALAVKSKIKLNANEFFRGEYDYHEIIEGYNKALAIDPNNPSTLNWIGLAYQLVGFQDKALEHFNHCIKNEPRYTPCVGNYVFTQNTIGNHKVAITKYTENLRDGVLSLRNAPFSSLATEGHEMAFLSALNSPDLFNGWHRNGEIYQAYRNPQFDYTELTKAAYDYLSKEAKKMYYWQFVLTPLGFLMSENVEYIDTFGTKHKDINHPKIKAYLKKAGIYDYWQQHGFPPQCKPKGADDFECE